MTTTKLYLDLRSKAKDGKGNIVISICNNRTTAVVGTGFRVSPSDWNGSSVINLPDSKTINISLQEQKNALDRSIAMLEFDDDVENMSAADIKKRITHKRVRKNTSPTVAQIIDEYISTGLKETTKDIYRITKKKVTDFAGADVRITDIDIKWLRQFDSYLAKTQSINGRAIYLRHLRAICNYAKKRKFTTEYAFENFSIKQVPTIKRNIEIEKFREFLRCPVTQSQQKYRDYFLLMFYLLGINITDLLHAKKSQVVNGRLEYTRSKTSKPYSIKIEPEAQQIIAKYAGKKYLLEALEHVKDYKNFLHMMNNSLKTIGAVTIEEVPNPNGLFNRPKKVKQFNPIIPNATTYYSRHTWATIARELGISIDVISQALGHPIGNRTTLIYINSDLSKVDEANRRVIDYLLQK